MTLLIVNPYKAGNSDTANSATIRRDHSIRSDFSTELAVFMDSNGEICPLDWIPEDKHVGSKEELLYIYIYIDRLKPMQLFRPANYSL